MMKSLVLALAFGMIAEAALAQAYTGPRATDPMYTTGRYRAQNENGQFVEPGNPLQQRAAAALAAEAGVACDMVSAAVLSEKHEGGGRALTYEIACKNDFGWILSKVNGKVSAYDCLALEASEKAAKGKLATCRLAENTGSTAGLSALAQKAGLSCKPVRGAYLGGGGEPPISRYEVLCDTGAGYIIDAPQPKSKAGMLAMSCTRAKAAGMGACGLKPAG